MEQARGVDALIADRPATGAVRRPFAPVPGDARPYAVRMRDGVLLATDVYLPDRGSRWPVLLSRIPYDKAGDECFMPAAARWFTERGFAVVVQDVRGKVRSDGPAVPFRAEVLDGYDTIAWITEQGWCAGPVGMFGDSYFGWTQWAAAASEHPSLRAIAPRVISADFADLIWSQGVFALEVSAMWAFETWMDEALYDATAPLDWDVRPLSEVVPAAHGGRRSRFLDELGAGRLDPAGRLPVRGDLPTLHLGGWWDILASGQLATWRRARASGRAPQYLIMDAMDHGGTRLRGRGEPYVDPRSSAGAMAAFLDSYLGPVEAFMRHHLGDAGPYRAPAVRWALGDEGWRESSDWPPPSAVTTEWFPTTGGALAPVPDAVERALTWTHDPYAPVPSRAHAYHPLIEPADQAPDAARDDVLTFISEPLRAPLDLAGPASVRVCLSAEGPSAHVMARLSDVAPDGFALKILDGAALATAPWPGEVTIDLGDTGYRLRPGHRLRLDLSASEFPRYAPHPGSGDNPFTTRAFRTAERSVILGGGRAARLVFSVLPYGALPTGACP